MIGPRVRQRRARRRGKILVLVVLLTVLALAASMTTRTIPTSGAWEKPTRAELIYARHIVEFEDGVLGEAKIYLARWPGFAPYLTGEVADPALCGPVMD